MRDITCIADILVVMDDYFMPPRYKHRLSTYINFSCEKGSNFIKSCEVRRSTVLKNYLIEPSNYICMGFTKVPNEDNCKFDKLSATGFYRERAEALGIPESQMYMGVPSIKMEIDWVSTKHDVEKTKVYFEHIGLKYFYVYDIKAGSYIR